jgi:uncharacterized protein
MAFQTRSGNEYYYDDWTGVCYPMPSDMKETLSLLNPSSIALIDETGGHTPWERFIVQRHRAYGAFYGTPFSCRDSRLACPEALAERISRDYLRQLVLIITNKCNLRCKYCIYSDHYPKTFSENQTMSPEIAIQATDIYLDNLGRRRKRNPAEPAIITFYGGEPLLNMALIADVIAHVKKRGETNVVYSLTTNGLLLTDDVSDFLVKHDFTIAISLDGPEQEHDRNRVYRDGSGSFWEVFGNIERFWQRHPEYKDLLFMVTTDYATDMMALQSFFDSREQFKRSAFFFSSVKEHFTDYYQQFSEEDILRFRTRAKKYKEMATESGHDSDPFHKYGVSAPHYLFLLRSMFTPPGSAEIPATGTCIPGDKICVLPDGTFQPCERIAGRLEMGSTAGGLDFPRIAEIIDAFNREITTSCAECPAMRLCPYCFSHFWSGACFERSSANQCEEHVARAKKLMFDLFSAMEDRPGFHDELLRCDRKWTRRARTFTA